MNFSDDQMRKDKDNGTWALFNLIISYTFSFNLILNNMSDTIMMIEDSNYVILQQAVFQEHVKKAEQNTNAQKLMNTTDRLIVYHFTSLTCELVNKFMKV